MPGYSLSYATQRWVSVRQAAFVEDATSVTHTATFNIPAGSTLIDIIAFNTVLWGAAAASLSIGDANSATGWFNAVDCKATDLVLGERLRASGGTWSWGGKQGAYLNNTTGVFGQASGNMISGYCATAYSVIAVMTVTTPSVTTGRTFVTVIYARGRKVTPVLA